MEYIEIKLKEHANGYSIELTDLDTLTKPVDEVHTERIQALKSLGDWVKNEIVSELKKRGTYAASL